MVNKVSDKSKEDIENKIKCIKNKFVENYRKKNKTKISEDLLKELDGEWNMLNRTEKMRLMENLKNFVVDDLGIKNTPVLVLYNDMSEVEEVIGTENDDALVDAAGLFNGALNTVFVSNDNINNITEIMKVLVHETRHCWQYEKTMNLNDQNVLLSIEDKEVYKQFNNEMNNYIKPEKNDDSKYANQLIEKDANEYAEKVCANLKQNILKLLKSEIEKLNYEVKLGVIQKNSEQIRDEENKMINTANENLVEWEF